MINKSQKGSAALFIAIMIMISMIPLALSVVDVNVKLSGTTSAAIDSQIAEAAAKAGIDDLNNRMKNKTTIGDCTAIVSDGGTKYINIATNQVVTGPNLPRDLVRNQQNYSFHLVHTNVAGLDKCTFTVVGYYGGIQHAYEAVFTAAIPVGSENSTYDLAGMMKSKYYNPAGGKNSDLGDYYYDAQKQYFYATDKVAGENYVANGEAVGVPATRIFNMSDPGSPSSVINDLEHRLGPVGLVSDNGTIFQKMSSFNSQTTTQNELTGIKTTFPVDQFVDSGSNTNTISNFQFTAGSQVNAGGNPYLFFIGARLGGGASCGALPGNKAAFNEMFMTAGRNMVARWQISDGYCYPNVSIIPNNIKISTINGKTYALISGGQSGLIVVNVTDEIKTAAAGGQRGFFQNDTQTQYIVGKAAIGNVYDAVYKNGGNIYAATKAGGIKTVSINFTTNASGKEVINLAEVANSAICGTSQTDFKRLAYDGNSTIFAVETNASYAGIYRFSIDGAGRLSRSNGNACTSNGALTTADLQLNDLSQGQIVNDIFYTSTDGNGYLIGGTTSEELFVVFQIDKNGANTLVRVSQAPIIGQIFDFTNVYNPAISPRNTVYTATTTGIQAVNAYHFGAPPPQAKIIGTYLDYGREASNGQALVRKIGVVSTGYPNSNNRADYLYLASGKVSDGSLSIKIISSYQEGYDQSASTVVNFGEIKHGGHPETVITQNIPITYTDADGHAANPGVLKDLKIDGNYLYLLTTKGLFAFKIDSSYPGKGALSDTPAFLPQSSLGNNTVKNADPYRIAANDKDIYVANYGAKSVYKVHFNPVTMSLAVNNTLSLNYSPTSIAVNSTDAYVGGFLDSGWGSYTGYVNRIPISGGSFGSSECTYEYNSATMCGYADKRFYGLALDNQYYNFIANLSTGTEYRIYQGSLGNPVTGWGLSFTPESNTSKMIALDNTDGLFVGGWDLDAVTYGTRNWGSQKYEGPGAFEPEPGHILFLYSKGDSRDATYNVKRLY